MKNRLYYTNLSAVANSLAFFYCKKNHWDKSLEENSAETKQKNVGTGASITDRLTCDITIHKVGFFTNIFLAECYGQI